MAHCQAVRPIRMQPWALQKLIVYSLSSSWRENSCTPVPSIIGAVVGELTLKEFDVLFPHT